MKQDDLRHRVAILLSVIHALLLFILILAYIFGWMDDDELKVSIPIVIPTFASFVTVVFEYITANAAIPARIDEASQEINKFSKTFTVVAQYTPLVFLFALLSVIIGQCIKHFAVGQYTILLGIVETGFAIYIGYVVKTLYKKNQ